MSAASPPRLVAPRWLWVTALLLLAGAAIPGVWAADLLLRPPPVEEEPEGLIFVLAAGVVAVFSIPLVLVASAAALRRRPVAGVLLGVSTAFSAMIALPPALAWVGYLVAG